jgi:uncharacterized membrane protein
MSAEALEWLNLLARWVHVIAGIMWVGNSMLFNWLDRNLRDTDSDHPAKFGETWMLHSGGFYRVEKFKASASTLPDLLHWFKWQSYTTWVSGFCLLLIVYFQGRGAYLLDPEVSNLTYGDAVALSLSLLAGGWMFYDLLWRIPARRAWAQNLISLVALVGATYLVCDHLSGRAAYLLMGALLGSLMAGNVFFHIIPSQKEMVAAIQAGHDQDMALANRAKQRSIHNNYMTFPVLFAMISNHFGGLYGHELNWVILLILFFTSALIRHFMNIRFVWKPWLPASAGTLAAAAALLMAIFHMDTSSRAAYTPGLDPRSRPIRSRWNSRGCGRSSTIVASAATPPPRRTRCWAPPREGCISTPPCRSRRTRIASRSAPWCSAPCRWPTRPASRRRSAPCWACGWTRARRSSDGLLALAGILHPRPLVAATTALHSPTCPSRSRTAGRPPGSPR